MTGWSTNTGTSLENITIKVLFGHKDYKIVKTFEDTIKDTFTGNIHLKMKFNQGICQYDKTSQAKYFTSLYQLIDNDFKCVVCNNNIVKDSKIILSHNFGHGVNKRLNFKKYPNDCYDFDQDKYEALKELFKWSYIYSFIHENCNEYHHLNNDDFGIIKNGLGNLISIDYSKGLLYKCNTTFESAKLNKLLNYLEAPEEFKYKFAI